MYWYHMWQDTVGAECVMAYIPYNPVQSPLHAFCRYLFTIIQFTGS